MDYLDGKSLSVMAEERERGGREREGGEREKEIVLLMVLGIEKGP